MSKITQQEAELAAKFVKELTGLEVVFEKHFDDFFKAESVTIDLATIKAIAPMFTRVELHTTLAYHDYRERGGRDYYCIELNYKYQHPTGGNGYTSSYYSHDNCQTFKMR